MSVLAIFVVIIVVVISIRLLFNVILFFLALLCPVLLLIYVLVRVVQYIKYKSYEHTLQRMTQKDTLEHLDRDTKKALAKAVYAYLNNKDSFRKILKEDLAHIGLGYTIGSLGPDKLLKIGVGYYVLNKYVKSIIKKARGQDETSRT